MNAVVTLHLRSANQCDMAESLATTGMGDHRIRPATDCVRAQSLLEGLYGVNVTRIKELDSYDDRNYHVHISDNHSNPHITEISPHGYVFKIVNSWDSKDKHVGK